jgi:hypothetical protein
MVRTPLTEHHLKKELDYFRDRFPTLGLDELFIVWFLRAFVTDSEDLAAHALTGVGKDKGIDAILIDDPTKMAFVIQGKYRQKFNHKAEGRTDILGFANLASQFYDT